LEKRLNLDCPETKSLGPYFGTAEARFLKTIPLKSSSISVTRIARSVSKDIEARVTLPSCDAFLLMIYLEDTVHSDVQADGSLATPRWCGKGSVCVVDLSVGASVVLHRDLSSLAIYLPRALIAEVAEISFPDQGKRTLRCRRAEPDQVISNLAVVILSLFDRDPSTVDPILRHLSVAVCTHLLQDCLEVATPKNHAILPVDREIAAKGFMRENLSRELTVAEIASITGLSAGHFAQGFKNVTGLTPHQWLIQARVVVAKDLLSEHLLSIKEVAKACGFVDQSHFTKVFSKEVGATPAQWRGRQLH
jgi:AraC-like DNA-binding protein